MCKQTRLKLLILCVLMNMSMLVWSQDPVKSGELILKSGETFVIKEKHSELTLRRLELGANSKIEFDSGVTQWKVKADQAVIAKGVVIDAQGASGKNANGLEGVSLPVAQDCQNGAQGRKGNSGENGLPGVEIHLQLGLQRLGDLTIDTRGGQGGAGGVGGQGGDAGPLKRCDKKKGGIGGDGGSGGAGGSAGYVTVEYWSVSETVIGSSIDNLKEKIKVLASGGLGGLGGAGGKGGQGSEAQYIKKRTLTGNRAWVAAGEAGEEGKIGTDGLAGKNGLVAIHPRGQKQLAKPVSPEFHPPKHSDNDYQFLLQKIEALEKRIQRLENQSNR